MLMFKISIHVPRVGDDAGVSFGTIAFPLFLSTSPAWGTTSAANYDEYIMIISIHVPRVGDDPGPQGVQGEPGQISIHVPRVGDDLYVVYTS